MAVCMGFDISESEFNCRPRLEQGRSVFKE